MSTPQRNTGVVDRAWPSAPAAPCQIELPGTDKRVAEGTLSRIVFANPESGFTVMRVDVDGAGPETWVGTAPPLQPGARLRALGRFEGSNHGPQFRCETLMPTLPTSARGIETYLASGAMPGIGPAIAKRIVAMFGADAFKVLTERPNDLLRVQGIGPGTVTKMVAAWEKEQLTAEVMAFLEQHGASPALAARIVKRYGGKALHVVSTQPYRLALEVAGVGFKTADAIAQSIGVAADSPERAEAATLHMLGDMTQRGHCYAVETHLVRETAKLLGPEGANVYDAVDRLHEAGRVVVERVGDAGEDGTRAVYPEALHTAEVELAARLHELLEADWAPLAGAAEAISDFERAAGVMLAPEQRAAVEAAARSGIVVLTGGPGTGKSFVTKAILAVFDRAKVKVLLASPTARAAKRLSEATGRHASTLHRMLGIRDGGRGFAHTREKPVDAGALILDEFSMTDTVLANAVLQALPRGARLVLVGDRDQLPSVGPGAVLRDVITSNMVQTVTLTRIFRQAEGSGIIGAAARINAGQAPVAPRIAERRGDEFFIEPMVDPAKAAACVVDLVANILPARFGFDPVRDVQVLTPMNRGITGTVELNALLQAALNPLGFGLQRGATTFRPGDPVMQLKNDYDRDVFNGDRGFVVEVDPERLVVDIDGRRVVYEKADLDHLSLAYACSVHKAQGATIPCVVMVMLREHMMLLSRNLLYTGVTRAAKLCVLVADPYAVSIALRETRREARCTRLAARLRYET